MISRLASWVSIISVVVSGSALAQETSSSTVGSSLSDTAAESGETPDSATSTPEPATATPEPTTEPQAEPGSVPAQTPDDGPRRRGEAIEEIVVTATKRETALQDTAVAVTALPADILERQQMSDLKSVTALVPNLQIGGHSDSAAVDVSLRGIVSTNRTELGDPAVAFHVDGFYSPRPQGATTLLYDVDRVEILRGPQGTLFGRNSNAGVINVITKKPDATAKSGSVDFTAGNYSLYRMQGFLNIPVYEDLAVRGAGFVENREGYIDFQPGSKVARGSEKYDNSQRASFRLSALWTPEKNISVYVAGEHFVDQGAGTVPVRIDPLPGTELRSALIDSAGELDMLNTTGHGKITYAPVEFLELVYSGGYARMTRANVSDNDVGFNAAQSFQQEHRTHDSKFLSHSHELQVRTVNTPYVDALVGGFFYEENNDIRFDIDINDDTDNNGIPNQFWAMSFIQPDRHLASLAGFGQVTWRVLESLRLTGGARYTKDTKSDVGGRNLVCRNFGASFDDGGLQLRFRDEVPLAENLFGTTPYPAGQCGSFPGNMGNDVKKAWKRLTWMGRVEFDLSSDMLFYGLVSTGFKSGVIQDGGITADPEEVINYELGAKTSFLDKRLAWNTVGFVSDYTDILRSRAERQADGSQQLVTRNATEALIVGVETELSWLITSLDRLTFMAAYLNAEYKDFPSIDNVLFATNDPASPVVNLKGNKMPFAPEFSLAAAFEHYFDFDDGSSLVPRIQTQFQTSMYLNDFNRDSDRQGAFSRTDLSIRYETASGWMGEIFVRNIEDSNVKSNVEIKGNTPGANGMPGDPGFAYAYYDAPRTFGARIAYRFRD